MHDSLPAFARSALGHEPSPRDHALRHLGEAHAARTHFNAADPKIADTYQREDIIEYEAIVVAGLILSELQQLRLTRVTRRGSRVDYFLGTTPGDQAAVLEVSGTDNGSLADRLAGKRRQVEQSFYRSPPFSMRGFVAVTHFSPPLASVVDCVLPEQ